MDGRGSGNRALFVFCSTGRNFRADGAIIIMYAALWENAMRLGDFGYAINYDKEIAKDERQIAYLTSDFAQRVGAWVDGQRAIGRQPTDVSDVFVNAPEIFSETLGLVTDDLRALWVYLSSECDPEKIAKDQFGPEQNGDYQRGILLLRLPVFFPLDADTWQDWRCMGEGGRKDALRLAKAAISRHKRNQPKFGR